MLENGIVYERSGATQAKHQYGRTWQLGTTAHEWYDGVMRVAIVHEWLTRIAGSERVVEAIMAIWPDAPVFTLVCDRKEVKGSTFENKDITTSFIQRLPGARRKFRRYLSLMPLAVEQFDLREFDVIISSSHAVAKGVLTRADQLHISYTHTPMRYAWDMYQPYLETHGLKHGVRGMLAKYILHRIRKWDVLAANRVDKFVANSTYIARRIQKTYRRDATVIHPPVDVNRFESGKNRDSFYLAVGRMVPYKKFGLVAEALKRMERELIVIGEGKEYTKLNRQYGESIQFLGRCTDEVVADHMERCRAFVYAGEEDFGITLVEAQAAGAPIIAFGKGGAAEIVKDGLTGILFNDQSVEGCMEGIRRFESSESEFNSEDIGKSAKKFGTDEFSSRFKSWVEKEWKQFQGKSIIS